ncbi:MAG TPA: pyruvate formate-lyase-activating protein [Tepidisphaeraceae bacterium]
MQIELPQSTVPLEAKSPYEMRVNLSRNVSQSVIKQAIDSGDYGFLHSFTTGSAVDGPGIRVVAWTAGCMWRCQFCHNPDTWTLTNGMPVSLDRAVEEMRKYVQGLKVMKGGLTVSGGEPLMQARFVMRLFAAAQGMGVHTALNTNGFLGNQLSEDDLNHVDLVIMDLKAWDSELHRRLTAKDVGPTLDFARRLAARKLPIWARFVLVPGLTDDLQDIEQIATFAAGLGNVERFDILPFHQMGRYKWKELGLDYKLEKTEPPDRESVQRVRDLFREKGLKAY